jgi:prepilin-type N-terminal cleavage/methylation domain-containing protein
MTPFCSRYRDVDSRSAFTLTELLIVMAVMTTLMLAGIRLLSNTAAQARHVSVDTWVAMIELARTRAITNREYIALAIVNPSDNSSDEMRCHLGLFCIKVWPEDVTELQGELLKRWQPLHLGIVPIAGKIEALINPIDQPQIAIHYGGPKNQKVHAYVIGFNPAGGLHYPIGNQAIGIHLAEGRYQNGVAIPLKHGANKNQITEERIQIGRATARPYLMN